MGFGKKPVAGAGTPPPAPASPQEIKQPPAFGGGANVPPAQQPANNAATNQTTPQQAPQVTTNAGPIAAIQQAASQDKAGGVPVARYTDARLETQDYKRAKWMLVEALLEKMDYNVLEGTDENTKKTKIRAAAKKLIPTLDVALNGSQVNLLEVQIIDEILGFGPLEPLMSDPDVSDIMVNTAHSIYIEKNGKLSRCDITFSSEQHLLNVIQRIVSLVGRRVDESSPMVDARMPDGSRFNAIIPPLAIDGSLVSIRKFKQNKMPLSQYLHYGSMTEQMVRFLEICAAIRLNILVSGGTGSGKTTMLNALSGHISEGERVITIEDAAELQMHQPHVLRLETRPANSEGVGEITQRELVKNALRMRPDRIILGEIRGDEVIDVLAAMNTGHEGSMATIHANNPRDCLSRIENLVGLTGISIPTVALRQQVSSALHLIVQLSRMHDGGRRVTHIEEVVGMEGDVISTQSLFNYKAGAMGEDGKLKGQFSCSGVKPHFFEQSIKYGLDKEMEACLIDPARRGV